MIRKDFIDTGFPISKTSPVICTKNNIIELCYNRFDLRRAIALNPEISCVGIWPGKRITDGFTLNPTSYINIPIPPEEHKDIDSAEKIIVFLKDKKFFKIEYIISDTKFESEDINLCRYIRSAGLNYSIRNSI